MTEIANGQIWRHKNRKTEYEIVATDGLIQVASIDSDIGQMLEDEDWIVYRSVGSHRLFFRMRPEFLDGRFVLIKNEGQVS